MTLKYLFYGGNRHKKATALIAALESRGWRSALDVPSCNALFVDSDVHIDAMQAARRRNKPIFIYPHAGRPNLFNDFPNFPIYPNITAGFFPSDGQIEIMRRINIPYPLESIGWFLCLQRPFTPRHGYRRVLFAPIHPNSDNALSDVDKQINIDTFKILVHMAHSNEIKLTVRYIRKLENNGLWIEPGVKYNEVKPQTDTIQMDEADLVVSHQTYAYIAIARGIPVVMMGESIPPRMGYFQKKDFSYANSWDQYKDLLMYPLDILAASNVRELFHEAISSDERIKEWRARMIGEPFNPNRFVDRVESYL